MGDKVIQPIRIAVWGTGAAAEALCAAASARRVEIVGFFDNDASRWGGRLRDRPIFSHAELSRYRALPVIVTSRTFAPVIRQLAAAGFDPDQIFDYYGDRRRVAGLLGFADTLVRSRYSVQDGVLVSAEERLSLTVMEDDLPCPRPLEEQQAVVRKTTDAYVAADRDREGIPQEYRVGIRWQEILDVTRKELNAAIACADIDSVCGLLGNYFRTDIGGDMGGGQALYEWFRREKLDSAVRHNFEVWLRSTGGSVAIEEVAFPPIGNPYGFRIDGALITGDAFLNHCRAYNARQLLQGLERPVVAEIGGGYGGFAYYFTNVSAGSVYIDFDVPENLLIASYFLSLALPHKRIYLYQPGVREVSDELLAEYDILLLPNFMLPALSAHSVDYFQNTVSFSEMEYATVAEYFRQIERVCRGYFYQENLGVAPRYKGFPIDAFPPLNGFRRLYRGISRWSGWDAYAGERSYLEELYVRS